ncbi:hypothetical protein [Agaricicola taiwanensis]|uniref:hypothetical protein n=1 Tax=Agaricicola taiwanensis TaxID=591372 RepID=UPI00166CB529|nr:hypothetical protein [Agaricicola taiwanensis]
MKISKIAVACAFVLMLSACQSTSGGSAGQAARAHHHSDRVLLEQRRRLGDIPERVRPVDVRFTGSASGIREFKRRISRDGKWKIVQTVSLEGGRWALDIQRSQAVTPEDVRGLAKAGIEAELLHDIEYDGWGAVIVTK